MASATSMLQLKGSATPSHAVSRTSELLSCARTALKIAKAQNPPPSPHDWWFIEPSDLELHQEQQQQQQQPNFPQVSLLSEDGLTLLRAMHVSLETLQQLVKRRGHVNDPTNEIASCTQQLETDAKELNTIVEQLKAFRSTGQHQKHLSLLAEWLQSTASQHTARLKEILKVRGTVLADQAQRRKLWNPQPVKVVGASAAAKKTLQESPLFTVTTSSKPNGRIPAGNRRVTPARQGSLNGASMGGAATSADTASAPSNSYGGTGYGGGVSTGYGGYYGAAASMTNEGIRQRRQNTTINNSGNLDVAMVQEQVQVRHEKRQTKNRLDHAKQAEKSLAELSTLFSKMSNLIVAQGETLDKIEDDVEAAHTDVAAGQAEIQILYSLKKGNRALILKTFAVVIFVILFMRLY
jgi:hypothetical protein